MTWKQIPPTPREGVHLLQVAILIGGLGASVQIFAFLFVLSHKVGTLVARLVTERRGGVRPTPALAVQAALLYSVWHIIPL
jgi:hypothetical protein